LLEIRFKAIYNIFAIIEFYNIYLTMNSKHSIDQIDNTLNENRTCKDSSERRAFQPGFYQK